MRYFALFVIILGSLGIGKAQNPNLKFKYFTQKDGLSSSFINCIGQDSTGFIWIGTNNGLNRFDGQHFKTYWAQIADSSKLPHFNITHIYTQHNGHLWFGTHRGLVMYDAQSDGFIRFKLDGVQNGDHYRISHIEENGSGELFVAVGNTIYIVNQVRKCLDKAFSIQDEDISKFIFSDNYIWISSQNSDNLVRLHQISGERLKIRMSEYYGLNSDKVRINALVLRNNKIWVGTLVAGIFSVDVNTLTVQRYPVNLPDADNALGIYVDRQNQLWTIDYTGLKFFNDTKGVFYGYYPVSSLDGGIRGSVSGFFQDNQNNYWAIHTHGGVGLHVYKKGFGLYDQNTPGLWHLSSNNINCIGDDDQGNIWLGNDKPGIDIFLCGKGRIESLTSIPGLSGSLGKGTVNVIRKDRSGQTWVGSYDGGLQKFDNSRRTFKSFVHQENNPLSLMGNDIRGISPDFEGNLWLVVHGKGIDKFNIETNKCIHYVHENSHLSNPWTNSVLCDRKGRVWVATAWGLNMLPKGEAKFKNYYFKFENKHSISSSNVISLLEASDGTIWIGTDQGLCRYVEGNDQFERVAGGMQNKTICAIEEDDFGRIWVSTLNGLSRIDNNGGTVFNFLEEDGILSNEFLPNSSFKGADGVIYFGGVSGVTYFNPANLRYNTIAPPIVITDIHIDNDGLGIDSIEGVKVIDRQFGVANSLKINYKHKIIRISFVGISFNNPAKNKYAIKLDGFDNQWQEIGSKTDVTYTNLEAGTYLFRVKAANNDGYWSTREATVRITITPPFYATLGFKIFSGIMTIILFWLLLLLRTRQLTIQRQLMANVIKQKTDELVASNQELLAQAEYLDNVNKLLEERQQKVESQSRTLALQTDVLRKNNRELKQLNYTKDRLFSIIAHDLLNPFTSIMGLSEVFKENYHDMTDEERLELASTVYVSSSRLFALLQNLLLWARSQTSSIKFDQAVFPLADVIQESTEYLNEQMQQKNIDLQMSCDPVVCVFADVDMVKTVIRNLVNNAVKFTPKDGRIHIDVTKDDRFAYISVIDNGIGMDRATAASLFDASNIRSHEGTAGEQGTGLGLLICKEFVERNKGEIQVHSEKGRGSTFKFSLPITAW